MKVLLVIIYRYNHIYCILETFNFLLSTASKRSFNENMIQQSFSRNANKVCVMILESIGGVWPTPQRGHWFPLPGDVTSFREKISFLCPKDEASVVKIIIMNSSC
jgi:hypothetical protein